MGNGTESCCLFPHTHDHPVFFHHFNEPLQENAEHKSDMMVSDLLLTFVNGHIYWTVSFTYKVKDTVQYIPFKKRFGNWLWFWDQVREYERLLKLLEFSADISHKLNNMKHTLLWLLH